MASSLRLVPPQQVGDWRIAITSTVYHYSTHNKQYMDYITRLLIKNDFVVALSLTALFLLVSYWLSRKLTNNKIPGSAIAIFSGLLLAFFCGKYTGGKKGVADINVLSGFSILGGAMFRDFAIVSTAFGANFTEIKK